MFSTFVRVILTLISLLVFSSCSTNGISSNQIGKSRFLFLQKELPNISEKSDEISSINFDDQSKVIIWMHGTDRPAIAGNLNCNDDMPPESLMLAANKLDISLYYLCSNATDSGIKGSFIYKRVLELEETINLFNEAGIKPHNIYLSGFSAGGWTALMAAKAIPRKFNKGVLFAPAFAGPRYETRFFPVWRKIIRPKQVKEIIKAEKLEFLIFAYEDDPFNRPKELEFLIKKDEPFPEIVGYSCKKGHFTYRKDCESKKTYERIIKFFQASEF